MTPPTPTETLLRLERGLLDDDARGRGAARRGAHPTDGSLRLLADASAILTALLVAAHFGLGADAPQGLGWTAFAAGVVMATFALAGEYGPAPRLSLAGEMPRAIQVPALVTLGVWGVRALVVGGGLPAGPLLETWLLLTVAAGTARVTAHGMRLHPRIRRRIEQRALVIGAGDVGRRVVRRLQANPALGLQPVGYLDKEPRPHRPGDLPVLGASWDLERVVHEQGVEAVVVSFSTAPSEVLVALVRRAWDLGLNVLVVPRLFEVEGTRMSMQHLGALPLVALGTSDPEGWRIRIKYALDRVAAAVTLIFLSPLLLGIALAVMVTMGRPIFYRQRRVGCDGQVFEMLKFRTMSGSPVEGEADAGWAAAVLGEAAGQAAAALNRDRRTPLGRFLRTWSLDELPQVINVLRGEMSLVGPRPERDHYVARFNDAVYRYADRHRVRSGITGWAQVNGLRGETSLEDRVEWDNYYIENWSLWMDLRIALRSLRAIARHRAS